MMKNHALPHLIDCPPEEFLSRLLEAKHHKGSTGIRMITPYTNDVRWLAKEMGLSKGAVRRAIRTQKSW